jgi:hypothetical protein
MHFIRRTMAVLAIALLLGAGFATLARAQDGGRLLATTGVVQIDGAGGGGLTPWALIAGYGSRDSYGVTAHNTYAHLSDFDIDSAGVAVGIHDRLELSYAHTWFDTRDAGRRLGLGEGYQFQLDTVGAKLRVSGKAVYDQDSFLPQISVGTQYKTVDRHALVRALGARSPDGIDYYVAATKIFLDKSLLTNITIRATRANQFGLLGFGGDRENGYTAQFEGSAALLLSRHVAVGGELRTKPDNLRFAHEGPAFDVFVAWFVTKHLSATLAFANLGPVALQSDQNGIYFSLATGL